MLETEEVSCRIIAMAFRAGQMHTVHTDETVVMVNELAFYRNHTRWNVFLIDIINNFLYNRNYVI